MTTGRAGNKKHPGKKRTQGNRNALGKVLPEGIHVSWVRLFGWCVTPLLLIDLADDVFDIWFHDGKVFDIATVKELLGYSASSGLVSERYFHPR